MLRFAPAPSREQEYRHQPGVGNDAPAAFHGCRPTRLVRCPGTAGQQSPACATNCHRCRGHAPRRPPGPFGRKDIQLWSCGTGAEPSRRSSQRCACSHLGGALATGAATFAEAIIELHPDTSSGFILVEYHYRMRRARHPAHHQAQVLTPGCRWYPGAPAARASSFATAVRPSSGVPAAIGAPMRKVVPSAFTAPDASPGAGVFTATVPRPVVFACVSDIPRCRAKSSPFPPRSIPVVAGGDEATGLVGSCQSLRSSRHAGGLAARQSRPPGRDSYSLPPGSLLIRPEGPHPGNRRPAAVVWRPRGNHRQATVVSAGRRRRNSGETPSPRR